MSDNDKKKRRNSETARRIWLAGIGAYGRAFTEAQGALKDVTGKSSEVFDDLVHKGEMIEKVVEYKGRELLDKTIVGDIDVPNLEIDERIKRMRERLSMGASSASAQSVNNRLDDIDNKIQALTARIEAVEMQRIKPDTRKRKAAKTVTERTKKQVPPK